MVAPLRAAPGGGGGSGRCGIAGRAPGDTRRRVQPRGDYSQATERPQAPDGGEPPHPSSRRLAADVLDQLAQDALFAGGRGGGGGFHLGGQGPRAPPPPPPRLGGGPPPPAGGQHPLGDGRGRLPPPRGPPPPPPPR